MKIIGNSPVIPHGYDLCGIVDWSMGGFEWYRRWRKGVWWQSPIAGTWWRLVPEIKKEDGKGVIVSYD